MLPNITFSKARLLCWLVAEPLFFLGVVALVHARLLPWLQAVKPDEWSDARREFDEFVAFYRESRMWWVSSLVGALFAATIGASGGVLFDIVAFSIFVVPALVYYDRYSPFGLRLTYVPIGKDSDDDRNVCRPRNGVYTILLDVEPGENVEDYQLDVHTPSGASLDRIDGVTSHLDEDRQVLYGVTRGESGVYTEALYIEKTGSISPDGELVLLKSQGEGDTIESIRLLPP